MDALSRAPVQVLDNCSVEDPKIVSQVVTWLSTVAPRLEIGDFVIIAIAPL